MARIRSVYRNREIGRIPDDGAAGSDVQQPQQTDDASSVKPDALDQIEMPERAKTWLRAHPQYMTDEAENAKITAVHHQLVGEGIEPYSAPYFAEVEARLLDPPARTIAEAMEAPIPAEAEEIWQAGNSRIRVRAAPKRDVTYSAPPSRGDTLALGGSDYSNHPSRITLTPAMKDAARISGISEAEYARQLLRLREEKAQGFHPGGQ